jgi:flagellin
MALTVNTNIASISTQRNLNKSSDALALSMQRLSSGLRINSAKDDAAGLQISNRLTSQIMGLGQAVNNVNNGISIAQTAEGAMQAATDLLQKMRTLALSSATGSLSADGRKANNDEYQALILELSRIAQTTTFGGQNLLDGSYGTKAIQVGANANETINLSLENVAADNLGSQQVKTQALVPSATPLAAGSISVFGSGQSKTITYDASASAKDIASKLNGAVGGLTAAASTDVKFTVDAAAAAAPATFSLAVGGGTVVSLVGVTDTKNLSDQLSSNAAKLGISVNYNEKSNSLEVRSDSGENLVFSAVDPAAAAAIEVDVKDGKGAYAGTATKIADAMVVTGQISLDADKGFSLSDAGTGVSALFGAASISSTKARLSDSDVMSADAAQSALAVIDKAISTIDSVRSGLGATQNRMTITAANLKNIQENSTAARSTVQDVDFAEETAELTRQQTLQQASTAILAQANQLPAAVLKLLQ